MKPTIWRGAIDEPAAQGWLAELSRHDDGSLRLPGVLDLDAVLAALAPRLVPLLGDGFDLLEGQCWMRRARPPHGWHQDGALHAAFDGSDTLLPIVTCWIALTDCGRDAPGLEWVEPESAQLLQPHELTDDAVRDQHAPSAFVRPELQAGDAVLFGGGLLHRTHVTPAMTRPRTSIELRFIASGLHPPRLDAEPRRPVFAAHGPVPSTS